VGNETIGDSSKLNDKTMLGYMIDRATLQTQTENVPYFTQVFSSTNRFVYLFQINYVTETKVRLDQVRSPINYGENATISGNVTDIEDRPLGTVVGVDLEYSKNQGQTWVKVDTYPAAETNGVFNITWAPPGGNLLVRMRYPGSEGITVESASDPQTLEVKRLNATLTLSSSTTSATLGQNVTFSWTMDPLVKDANVTLFYTLDNRTYQKIQSFIMNSSSMSYTWKVSVSGTFRVVIGFPGNDNYNESISAAVIMKVA
jgi:hypothetical protein